MKSNSSSLKTEIVPPIVSEDLANDDFLWELDVAFDAIQMTTDKKSKSKKVKKPRVTKETGELAVSQGKYSDMQLTFIEISRQHLNPISRYLKAIRMGITSKDILEVMDLILAPLGSKTKKVGLDEHATVLRNFQRSIKKVLNSKGKKIEEKEANALIFAFANVSKTFELKIRGHSTAVLNVVAFYQSLKKNKAVDNSDIKRLFGIGLGSLTMLRQTSIDELCSLTGISRGKVTQLRKLARNFTLFELV